MGESAFPSKIIGHMPTSDAAGFKGSFSAPDGAMGPAVDSFCSALSSANSRIVRDAVEEIATLRREMAVNMLAVGDRLGKLRGEIGPERFSRFMVDVLPALGISRATGYRWLGFAEKLAPLFPNPLVRQHLMVLTNGKGLVANAKKDNKRNTVKVILSPAAELALKTLPPAPKSDQGHLESELWVRAFIKATAKARSQVRAPGRNLARDQSAIIQSFNRFAAHYGPQAAEDLCGCLDKTLTEIVNKGGSKTVSMRARVLN